MDTQATWLQFLAYLGDENTQEASNVLNDLENWFSTAGGYYTSRGESTPTITAINHLAKILRNQIKIEKIREILDSDQDRSL